MKHRHLERLLNRQLERERRAVQALQQRRRGHDAAVAGLECTRQLAEAQATARSARQAKLYSDLIGHPVSPAEILRCNDRIDALWMDTARMQARVAQAEAAAELASAALAAERANYGVQSRKTEKWRRLVALVERRAALRQQIAQETEIEEILCDRLTALATRTDDAG